MGVTYCCHIVIVLVCFLSDKLTEAYINCGSYQSTLTRCYGSGAYCCGLYKDECCWETVYSYWWFWFIWAWLFILITACSVCICIRRRRRLAAQPRYVIVESQPPTYGAVSPPSYAPVGTAAAAATPYMPPTAPSYMEKPPPYNTVAGNQ